jgi:hypothetical protein
MIQANCRARFTGEDFNFVVRTLARRPGQEVSLVELLTDLDTRDQVLDDETLVQAVLENPGNLCISPQFYFYLLARLVLKRSGLNDRTLADYLGALLEKFSRTNHLNSPVKNVETHYISDLLLALKRATPYETFLIRAHVGNYALFISGIFYENVSRRRQRGAPDCSYYEDMGRSNFQAVATHDVARRYDMSGLFANLADHFRECRIALNRLADELLDLGDNQFASLFV